MRESAWITSGTVALRTERISALLFRKISPAPPRSGILVADNIAGTNTERLAQGRQA